MKRTRVETLPCGSVCRVPETRVVRTCDFGHRVSAWVPRARVFAPVGCAVCEAEAGGLVLAADPQAAFRALAGVA